MKTKMQATDLKEAVANAEKGSALQDLVDGFFAGLEARTTNGIAQGLLKGANKIVDFAMTAYGLTLLLSAMCVAAASAQSLPRARDVVTEATLPRARDYVEVAVVTHVELPCKNCGCGCPEAPCSCDKTKEVVQRDADSGAIRERQAVGVSGDMTAPASASAGEEQEAGVSVSAAQPQRFFRYRPAYQRGRACST